MTNGARDDWAEKWLAQVHTGTLTMSQRTLASVQKNCGLAALARVARTHKIHLLQLTDDRGKELVVASRSLFKVLC